MGYYHHHYNVEDTRKVICCPFCMSPNELSVEFAHGDRTTIPVGENAWRVHCNTCTRSFSISMTDESVLEFERRITAVKEAS
jgi:hypothetical protein